MNVEADLCSRIIDYDDWGIHPQWFQYIANRLGFPSFDRFADQNNKKTALYNSRFYTSDTSGVNAFTQDWVGHLNWVVPPIHLIGRAISYMELLQCQCILVVPIWYSSYFWPQIHNIVTNRSEVVEDYLILGDIYMHYRNKATIFGSDRWTGQSLAVRLNFANEPPYQREVLVPGAIPRLPHHLFNH